MSMTVRDIITEKIKATPGCDGLCNEDCGCGIDDFAPCYYGPHSDCMLAKLNDGIYVQIKVCKEDNSIIVPWVESSVQEPPKDGSWILAEFETGEVSKVRWIGRINADWIGSQRLNDATNCRTTYSQHVVRWANVFEKGV